MLCSMKSFNLFFLQFSNDSIKCSLIASSSTERQHFITAACLMMNFIQASNSR
jgi:hypothetical protein